MLGFFIFAAAFAALLTLIVRFGELRVRADLPETKALGLTLCFAGLVLLGWWVVTQGATVEARMLSPIILPSPLEVLQAFPKLHFEQPSLWHYDIQNIRQEHSTLTAQNSSRLIKTQCMI